MTRAAQLKAGSIGLHRFGLGERLGDSDTLRLDIRERFLAEVSAGDVQQPANPPYPGAAEIGKALYAYEDDLRARRAAKPASMVPSQPPAADGLSFPMRVYRDEVRTRLELALQHVSGFAERMVIFWANHFCVAATKSTICRIMAGAYEREAIRPHVFGRFENMLIAAESHPAMLDFLDNRLSIGPNSSAGKGRRRGFNENLAREILELHTLGTSGGYSQGDVTNLARIITGWTVVGRDARLGLPGSFAFNPASHEPGAPRLLGKRYDQPGKEKGLAALRDLAHHPATADFIAFKLSRHFVADQPPPTLVSHLSQIFRRTEGDLAAVSRALIESDVAWTAEPTKIRSPQEFAIATFRAFGPNTQTNILGPIGVMRQSFWQPTGPNGYPDTNAAWASPEGVKTRVDVAADWGRQAAASVPDPRALTTGVLGPLLSPQTRQAVARAESKPQALALLLMSPEFQRR